MPPRLVAGDLMPWDGVSNLRHRARVHKRQGRGSIVPGLPVLRNLFALDCRRVDFHHCIADPPERLMLRMFLSNDLEERIECRLGVRPNGAEGLGGITISVVVTQCLDQRWDGCLGVWPHLLQHLGSSEPPN